MAEQKSDYFFEQQIQKLIQNAKEKSSEFRTYLYKWVKDILENLEELAIRGKLIHEGKQVPVDRVGLYLIALIKNEDIECSPWTVYKVIEREGLTQFVRKDIRQVLKETESIIQEKIGQIPISDSSDLTNANANGNTGTGSAIQEPQYYLAMEEPLTAVAPNKEAALKAARVFFQNLLSKSDDEFAQVVGIYITDQSTLCHCPASEKAHNCHLQQEMLAFSTQFNETHGKGIHTDEFCNEKGGLLHQWRDGRWDIPNEWKLDVKKMIQANEETLAHIGKIFKFVKLKELEEEYAQGKGLRFTDGKGSPFEFTGKWVSKIGAKEDKELKTIVSEQK